MKPRFSLVWLAACRPRTLPAAIAPVVVGSALAGRDGRFDAQAAGLCLVFALMVQIGTNFANDYSDFLKGADTPGRVGPARAVATGAVAPRTMRHAALAVFMLAFLIGLGLIRYGGPWMVAIGVASIVSGLAYTGGPYPLGYHGLGDLFVFVFFGLIGVGATYFVQAGRVGEAALAAAVPVGLLAANILVMNNYRDAETDAAAGKRTLVVRFGRRAAVVQVAVSLIVALVVPILFLRRGYGWPCLLPLALAPLASLQVHRMRASGTPAERIALLGDAGRFLGLYAALFALGLVFS